MYNDERDTLKHFGVKGMHWGVRRARPQGVSKRTNREAFKDAVEYSRAKMYYGDGAGTRRKLIKNTVEAKAKKDPKYKEAFDFHMDRQDMSIRAAEARSKRKRTDAVNKTAKTVRGVKNVAVGNAARASTTAVALVSAYNVAKRTGMDKKIIGARKKLYQEVKRNL